MAFFRDEPKLQKCFVLGKELIGAIMITTSMKTLKDFSNRIMLPILSSWIPSLDGGKVEEKLKRGGTVVADVGCSHAISTILMAKAYPGSKFIGYGLSWALY
jgi:hypothetical protein